MDTEQERSSGSNDGAASDDGAGPKPHSRLWLAAALAALAMLLPRCLTAQRAASGTYADGLSVSLTAGGMLSSNHTANFYSGIEGNANTIYRVLHSAAYGPQIWADLTSQGSITSAVSNYGQLRVAEYGAMRYKTAVQLHMGLRYDYPRANWGWLLLFSYARLTAAGAFLLDATNGTGPLTNKGRYVSCPLSGEEVRLGIDAGVAKRFRLRNGFDIGVEGGVCANNTRVESSVMHIAGRNYSILDVWGGASPDAYTQEYEYMNQGGLGYGLFGTVTYGITLRSLSSLAIGYSAHYLRINLEGYQSFAMQHLLFVRIDWAPHVG